MPAWFDGFDAGHHTVDGLRLFARTGGRDGAPPLLLLHGFPQTHAMWHRVAQVLAPHFRLVLPDLPGYGDSDAPPETADHAQASKRRMAAALHGLMRQLGHARYGLVAHDRGARVAHRLALEQPGAVERLVLVDIAPTLDMYQATDRRLATAYEHWFSLIQPAPFPERLIAGDPRFYLHSKLGAWGTAGLAHLEPEALAEYERCWARPAVVHAACEDYRASAGIDLEHDRAARAAGERIGCDTLLIWGTRGVIHRLFDPLALWQAQCAARVLPCPLDCGHFVPEERPAETADALLAFLQR